MQFQKRMEIKLMKLSDLVFDKDNPNRMDDKEKKALLNSLKKFGYVQPIIIDKNSNMIADGEHRVKALIESGITEVEVIAYQFKDDIERRVFRQVANKLHGVHSEELDAKEYRKILEKIELEELTSLTSISEQEILNVLNKEQIEPKQINEVEKLGRLEVTCPHCGYVFQKGER